MSAASSGVTQLALTCGAGIGWARSCACISGEAPGMSKETTRIVVSQRPGWIVEAAAGAAGGGGGVPAAAIWLLAPPPCELQAASARARKAAAGAFISVSPLGARRPSGLGGGAGLGIGGGVHSPVRRPRSWTIRRIGSALPVGLGPCSVIVRLKVVFVN